jgi:isopenicillin N synthase-like dioxygenase
MVPTKYADRHIPKISLSDFSNRVDEITFQLIQAAETDGFFGIIDHGIPVSTIDNMFATSEAFFSLPDTTKATIPFSPINNVGWEKNAQVRPSTGVADQKESYNLQFGAHMEGMWLPNCELPGFKDTSLDFMQQCQEVSEKLMICFARGLGFPDDYFIKTHDVSRPNSQTALTLLYYPEVDKSVPVPDNYYRAGIHTDWDFITLLFQRAGQSGLEICPGREAVTG